MKRRDFAKGLLLAPAVFLDGRVTAAGREQLPRINAARLSENLTALAQFGRNDKGGITRVAYSDADRQAREFVMGLMRAASLEVRIDTAGNIVGRRNGREPTRPVLMTGSHIDSVPEGGNFDGQVGSIAAIEVAHTLADARMPLRDALEVVIFQNEENGKIGSKAMRGQDPATYLDLPTHSGKTVREGIRFIGGNPDRVLEARRAAGTIKACVELHIEQGGVLHSTSTQIGIVEGIVGIRRWQVTVTGFANHAGTTPMDRRQDALLGAAQFIQAVNRIVRSPQRRAPRSPSRRITGPSLRSRTTA